MDIIYITLFLISGYLIIHTYLVYPILLYLISFFLSKNIKKDTDLKPKVSIIISVFNEEMVIENTIRHLFNSSYDQDKIEIVVGSDNSFDRTNDILFNLSNEFKNLKFIPFLKRRGKAKVLNDLVKISSNEILIFCDANTIYEKNSISELVKYYSDTRVGGVCGRLLLIDLIKAKKEGSKEKEYWEYESWIKKMEGKLGILIGANGGIYSIRSELFIPLPDKSAITDDFYVSLKILEQKKYMLYAPEAVAREYVAPTLKWEFRRKVRMISTNFETIFYVAKLLTPAYGLIAYAFWSHKVFRWLTPLLLFLILFSNTMLLHISLFKYFFIFQFLYYFFALIGYLFSKIKINIWFFSLPYYFILTNLAIIVGFYRFVLNKHSATWQSTERM